MATLKRRQAEATAQQIEQILTILHTADAARIHSEKCREITLCIDHGDMMQHANDGAPILGPWTDVSNGDKRIGANQALQTKRAGRYSDGLWASTSQNDDIHQKVATDEAATFYAECGSRLQVFEGLTCTVAQCNAPVCQYTTIRPAYGEGAPYCEAAK